MPNEPHLQDTERLIDRLLRVIEREVVPLTEQGVRQGNKIFGAAILRKSDLSTVLVETNNERENPLWHGEVHAIKRFYELPETERPAPKDCLFLSTHEPCSLCLSAITWSGFDNFYYLYGHEDSRDSFNIPHDLRILKEVFHLDAGCYAQENHYWKCYCLTKEVAACEPPIRKAFQERIVALNKRYAELSNLYQASKGDAPMPLT